MNPSKVVCDRCKHLSLFRSQTTLNAFCRFANRWLRESHISVVVNISEKEWSNQWNLKTPLVKRVMEVWQREWHDSKIALPNECPFRLEHVVGKG